MADIAVAATSNAETQQQSPSKKTAAKKDKKVDRPKASHPTTAVMVNNAIQNLKERGGSSLQAIKKYISATYKVEGEKFAPFIKKYLKASVASGTLVQTKGKGASGSFKLASTAVTKKTTATTTTTTTTTKSKKGPTTSNKATVAKAKAASKTTTAAERTTTVAKKAAASKTTTKSRKALSVTVEKKQKSIIVAKPKSPSKAKKSANAPTKKPKSPKPKSTKPKVTKKKVSPRKK